MKVEFFLSSSDIEGMKSILSNVSPERKIPTEFCWGRALLLGDGACGEFISLGHISLVDFFYDIKTFLAKNKLQSFAEDSISDMYQSYGIFLEKQKDEFSVKTFLKQEECLIKSDYTKTFKNVRSASQFLFKDILYHVPEIEGANGIEIIREMLM